MYLTKRQKQILDYIGAYIEQNGYAPTLEEMGAFFGLSSPATVYKHVQQLVQKGYLRKARHQGRGLELVRHGPRRSIEVPVLGQLRAGHALEAHDHGEVVELPPHFATERPLFVLRVSGDSSVPDQMREGDLLVLEDRARIHDGDTVVAVTPEGGATVGRYFRRGGGISLQHGDSSNEALWLPHGQLQVRGVVVGLVRDYASGAPAI